MTGFLVQSWSELGRQAPQFGDRARMQQAPRDSEDERSVMGAAWRLENTVGSSIANDEPFDNWVDESYNPFEDTDNEGYYEYVYRAKNAAHARVLRNNVDQQLKDRETLEQAGVLGFLATIAVSAADPVNLLTMLIPGGTIVRGGSVLRAAATGAAAGFAGAGIVEYALKQDQTTRTEREMLINMAASGMLGALFGGLGQAAFKRAYPSRYELLHRQARQDVREALTGERASTAGTPAPGSVGAAGILEAGGAKLRNARVLEWMRDNPVAQIMVNMSPGMRGMLSRSRVMRQLTNAVSEHGLRLDAQDIVDDTIRASSYKEYTQARAAAGESAVSEPVWNKQLDQLLEADQMEDVQRLLNEADDTVVQLYRRARAAETSPAAVETLVKRWQGPLADAYIENDKQFYQYLNRMKAAGKPGDQVLDFSGFNEAVGRALRKSDRDLALEPPEIQAAAGKYRQLFDGLRDEALNLGLFPKGIETAEQLRESISDTADNYFTRQFDFNAITARRAEFEKRVGGWYEETLRSEIRRQEAKIAEVEARGMSAADLADRTYAEIDQALDFERGYLSNLKELSNDVRLKAHTSQDTVAWLDRDVRQLEGRARTLSDRNAANEQASINLRTLIDTSGDTDAIPGWERQLRHTEREASARRAELISVNARLADARKRLRGARNASRYNPKITMRWVTERIAAQNDRIKRLAVKQRSAERAAEAAKGRRSRQLQDLRARVSELEDEFKRVDEVAGEITQSILSQPIGASAKNVLPKAGPLKERVLGIPDSAIDDFLVNDARIVATNYTRQMAPEVEIARWLDGRTMDEVRASISEDYNALREQIQGELPPADMARINELGNKYAEAGTRAERAAIKAQLDEVGAGKFSREMKRLNDLELRDKRDLEAMLARIKGVYGTPDNPNSPWVRASRALRQHALVSKLGGMTLSAMPDVVRHTMRGNMGLTHLFGSTRQASTFMEGVRSGVRALRRKGALTNPSSPAHAELRRMGAVTEIALNGRVQQILDFNDYFAPRSRVEKLLQRGTDSFGKVSLMAHWNEAQKTMAGLSVSDTIMRAVQSGTQLKKLRASGIDEGMMLRIRTMLDEHMEVHDGLKLSRSDQWSDKDAARVFEAAVIKEVDLTIVTPGVGDRPLWMSTELGKLLGLFRSFSFASHNRMLMAGMTGAGGAWYYYLSQIAMLAALGYATGEIKSRLRSGGERGLAREGDTPQGAVIKSLEYAGLGTLMEFNNILHAATGYSFRRLPGQEAEAESGRFAGRNAADAVFGPAAGAFSDILRINRILADEKFTQTDVNALWKIFPYQNLFYLQWALNKLAETATGEPDIRKMVGEAAGAEQ